MSQSCRVIKIPLTALRPRWVEFTSTKGVLRCLNANDHRTRAQGLVFSCPRCAPNKKKAHFCIFLFDNAPPEARPQGRFLPSMEKDTDEKQVPENFDRLSLVMRNHGDPQIAELLRPQDISCRWEGVLNKGVVSWRPMFLDRVFGGSRRG